MSPRRALILLLALAALWGASYYFIKVGLRDLSPAAIVFARTALAALVLIPAAIRGGGLGAVLRRPGAIALLALIQVAGPFMLISAGERHIPSSLAGILVASMPILTALLAPWLDRREVLTARGLLGIAVGIAGVALLFGVDVTGSAAAVAGGLMVLLASLGYALGAFALKRWFRGTQPLPLVAGTMAASALMTLPFAAASAPSHVGAGPLAAMAALGVGGTGIAFVIYYGLNHAIGPTRTSLVAYIAPVFSVVYGVTLLDESFGIATAIGIVLIVSGSWLAARAPAPRTGAAVDAPAAEEAVRA